MTSRSRYDRDRTFDKKRISQRQPDENSDESRKRRAVSKSTGPPDGRTRVSEDRTSRTSEDQAGSDGQTRVSEDRTSRTSEDRVARSLDERTRELESQSRFLEERVSGTGTTRRTRSPEKSPITPRSGTGTTRRTRSPERLPITPRSERSPYERDISDVLVYRDDGRSNVESYNRLQKNDEARVDRLVRGFINVFTRNPSIWNEFKDVVETVSQPVSVSSISQKNQKGIRRSSLTQETSSDDIKEAKDFLMECKCLFLRTRTPSKSTLQYIIEGIWPDYSFNSSQASLALTKAHNNFDSWRNSLNKELRKKSKMIIEQKELTRMPSTDSIKRYVDDSVIKGILKFWTNNLKQGHLDDDPDSYMELKEFVRKAIEVHLKHILNGDDKTKYITNVLEKVKGDEFTDMTKDIHVPSASNLNLADSVEI